jgi:hypothetical protein
MTLGMLLAVPTVALAADLLTEAELSSDVNARTEVAPNDTTDFNIKVWARGNINANNPGATGKSDVVNAYTMSSTGSISPGTTKTTLQFNVGHNYGTDGQTCPTSVAAQPAGVTGKGCASDPFIVPATLTVGNVDGGTDGTLAVSLTGSPALTLTSTTPCSTSSTVNDPNSSPDSTDCSLDQGFVSVTVTNNDPTVSDLADDANGTEGDPLHAEGAFADADGDTLQLSADNTVGDFDGDNGDGTWTWDLTTDDDVDPGTITVTADDGNGGTVTDSFDYSAANADPSATFNSPSEADEGSTFNLSLSDVTDAGSADTHEYRFDCGSGTFGDWGAAASTQCSAGDGLNTLTVRGQVRDDDDGLSAEYSGSVTVNNLAPVVTLAGDDPQSVNENKNGSESFSFTATDPGGDAITSVSVDCDADSGTDDGVLQGSQPTVSNNMSFNCRFPDGPASAKVLASATDDDGATGSDDKTVTIANVAPTLSNLQLTNATGTACIGGNTVSITYSDSDPGNDTFSLDPGVNWGDGTTNTSSSHTYSAGTYTISVQGKDSDGAASNVLTSNTNEVSLLYKMSGILSPFNSTPPYSTFKHGSTVPVKVQITDCLGNPVSGLAPKLSVIMVSGSPPVTSINEDIVSTSAADSGSILRYSDGQYIYNMNTKSSLTPDSTATYTAVVKGLNTANQVVTTAAQASQQFALKTK